MILVDTAVWIDHLHKSEPALVNLLDGDRVGSQSLVLQELTLGSLRQRDVVLSLLSNLFRFPDVGHAEFLHLVEERRLWGRGLSVVDVQLMAAVLLMPGAQLWTRDKRLMSACLDVGVQVFPA